MSVVEKRKYIQENVDGVPKDIISRWVQKWANIRGIQPTHPDYERAHKFFLSLPADMNLNEKRQLLRKTFPNVSTPSIKRWLKKWSDEAIPVGAPPSHPERENAREIFFNMPRDLTIEEKRKFLREKMPNVNRRTICYWSHQWQSEIYTE